MHFLIACLVSLFFTLPSFAATIASTPLISGNLSDADKFPISRSGSGVAYTGNVTKLKDVIRPNTVVIGVDSDALTLVAANTDADNIGKTIVLNSPVTLAADLTLATDRAWRFDKGAMITTTGYTFNANGAPVDIGNYQVFTGSGTVTGLKEVRPDWWGGNSVARITSAITSSLGSAPHPPVVFSTLFDITGQGTITIPTKDRELLVLQGAGGGIQKNDSGYVFTNQTIYDGDIKISDMLFQSTGGAGAILINGNRIVRVVSNANQFRGWDTVIEANTGYIQQFDSLDDRVIGGQGWVASFRECFSANFIGMTIEDRNVGTGNGIGNSADIGALQNRNLNISNCVIENNSGTAIKLAGSFKTTISDNYFELNAGDDIDMQTFNTWPHYGLSITGNMFGGAAKAVPSILWGKIAGGATSGKGGAVSTSNTSDHALHSIDATNTGFINGEGDYSAGTLVTGTSKYYVNNGQYVAVTNADSSESITIGYTKKIKNSKAITITAGAVATAKILFTDTLEVGDMLSVYVNNSYNIEILASAIDTTPGAYGVNVWVRNLDGAASLNRTLTAVIYKLGI